MNDETRLVIDVKRLRSAKSQLKNPPQPRFCIREWTQENREIFINVLSYSRIANQLSEFDPIPLYGAMQIRSFSSIKNALHIQQTSPPPPLIFAVMASPEVLRKTGRNCADVPEQMNLVELICEFFEAMNPEIVLSKKPEILKDRDLAGELKDVWSAVQNFRDKEKADFSDIVVYTEFGPETAPESPLPVHQNEASNGMITPTKAEQDDACSEKNETDSPILDICNGLEDNTNLKKGIIEGGDLNNVDLEKLSISDKNTDSKEQEIHMNNEKIVKIQNQKNKETQHTFFPKFLSSSKDKEEKAKEKEKNHDELESKGKSKKSLNFFRRSKSSSSSPTHTSNNLNNKTDNDH